MKKILFRTVLSFSILVLLVLLFSKLNKQEKFLELNPSISETTNTLPLDRIWYKEPLKKVTLNQSLSDSLLNTMILKQFNDTLYVVDYADMKIKRFTKNGHFVDNFGKNIGRGPEDFLQILDFTISHNKLYAIDANTFLVKVLDLKKEQLFNSIKVETHISRVITIKEKKIFLNVMSPDIFKVYGSKNSFSFSFGDITNGEITNTLSFGGNLIPSKNQKEFIYVPRNASYLFFFNEEGKNVKTTRTIDRLEFPKSTQTSTGVKAPSHDIIAKSVTYDSSYNYIQYTRRPIENHSNILFQDYHSFIDIYSRDGEQYFKTLMLPERSEGVTVIGDTLYTINNSNRNIEAFLLPEIE